MNELVLHKVLIIVKEDNKLNLSYFSAKDHVNASSIVFAH